jgi:putative ABC transport system ATP-binding protein
MPGLAASGLVVEIGSPVRRILDRVDLALAPGAMAAITGPSGAGKTTLLHALAGLVTANAGAVTFEDRDIGKLSESRRDRWRRETIGFVFQDFQLVPELSIAENILLPLRFDAWRATAAQRIRLRELGRNVGLGDLTPRAAALSRGEQQRVALARALIRRPAVILADEPTASLDADNAARAADLLIETPRESGASLLVVSHDAILLERMPAVWRLAGGRLHLVPASEVRNTLQHTPTRTSEAKGH